MTQASLSWRWVVCTALCIAAVYLTVYWDTLVGAAYADELCYVAAARAVAGGYDSASVLGWYYPHMLAVVFSIILEYGGEPMLLAVFRSMTLAGVSLWIAFCGEVFVGVMGGRRCLLPIAVITMMGMAVARDAFIWGNIGSVLFIPLALFLGGRIPALALALACTIKPYALGLVFARGSVREGWCAALVVAIFHASGGTGGLFPFITFSGNGSFARGFVALGLPWQIPVAIALLGAVVFGQKSLTRGVCFAWLALPIVWPHTSAMLLFPLVCALGKWMHEHRSDVGRLGGLATVFVTCVVNNVANFLPLDGNLSTFLFSEIPAISVILLMFLTQDPPFLRRAE